MMGVYKPREEASEWNLSCQHFNLWLSSLQNNEKFLLFSHPVYAIDILLWQSKLMQRDNERSVVSLFFFFFVTVAIVTIIFIYNLLHMGNQMQSRPYSLDRKFLCQKQICHRWIYFCIWRNFVTGSGETVQLMD